MLTNRFFFGSDSEVIFREPSIDDYDIFRWDSFKQTLSSLNSAGLVGWVVGLMGIFQLRQGHEASPE